MSSMHKRFRKSFPAGLSLLMNRYAKFRAYCDGQDSNPGRDGLFFNATTMMMSNAEFDRFY